jgi:hypothetical protein
MEDPFGGDGKRSKADEVAVILNKLIHSLSIRCAKSDGINDYFHIGVVGYGGDVAAPAFGGALAGKSLVPISEVSNNPLRIEDRTKKVDDGAGGIIEETVKFPVWFEPTSKGGTPMCAALKLAAEMMKQWAVEHPDGFPPVVINITDGEANDGDPVEAAKELAAQATSDGPCMILNVHLSSTVAPPLEMPAASEGLADNFAKQLFDMSSTLTPFMIARATELGMTVVEGARGFVFNAQPVQVIQFLDIGTRPANLR